MFRGGRGGQRKSYEGNRTPQRGNFGGKKRNDWTPYKKPQNNTPGKQVPNEDKKPEVPVTPETNDKNLKTTPTPVKVGESNGPQVQNIKREPAVVKSEEIVNAPQVDETKDAAAEGKTLPDGIQERVNRVKYTGRDGEKKFSGRCRLFVANLNNSTTEEELRELFGQFGETGEVFVNKDKGFGFIRLDFRQNAEMAKSTLDKKMFKGRNIQVRFATHASAIELHGLDRFATNEYIEKAMSQFGKVERSIVVCDDRGRSKGYAIVEFEWKKSAQKVLDRFKGEMFVLGRLPKPVYAKPLTQIDEEEGVKEEDLARFQGFEAEREFQPRFISPSSYEYTLAKKWRDLYVEEEDKKARLDLELRDARYKLEIEMESALQEQEAMKMREELRRRQEELRQFEENIIRRQEMAMRFGRESAERRGDYRNVQREENLHPDVMGDPSQNEFLLQQQQGEVDAQGDIMRVGIRPEMLGQGLPLAGVALQQHAVVHGVPHGSLPPPPAIPGIHMRPPPPQRDLPPQRGERFDHKRARRE